MGGREEGKVRENGKIRGNGRVKAVKKWVNFRMLGNSELLYA